MPLSREQIRELLRLVGLTRDEEIDCDACLLHVAEFVEFELADKTVPEGLDAVRHHLAVCPECRAEYDALRRALGDLDA